MGKPSKRNPQRRAPRLYEESLNEMIDQQTVRIAGLNNRVPTEVLLLEVIGSVGAMFLVGLHVGLLGRSLIPLILAASLVTFLLYVSFDLDRPTRGYIEVPDAPLNALQASMHETPASSARPDVLSDVAAPVGQAMACALPLGQLDSSHATRSNLR